MNEALNTFLDLLERLELPYMIGGSFASNVHGQPRMTQDIDIVIRLNRRSAGRLVTSLGDDFYVSEVAVREALQLERMFNVIHIPSGFKIDVVVLKGRPFSQSEFSRRVQADLYGRRRWFAAPEDTILAKLEWAKLGQSERQMADAAAIVQVSADRLDWPYVRKWASELGVEALLGAICQKANEGSTPE